MDRPSEVKVHGSTAAFYVYQYSWIGRCMAALALVGATAILMRATRRNWTGYLAIPVTGLAIAAHYGLCLLARRLAVPAGYWDVGPEPEGFTRIEIPLKEGRNVAPLISKTVIPDAPWLLYFPGNGIQCAQYAPAIAAIPGQQPFNILAVDWHLTGERGGAPQNTEELVEMAVAAMNYLVTTHNAKSNTTLIFGHSLGGGVAAQLRAHYPEGPIAIDRSYSAFSRAANMMVRYGGPLPGLIAAYGGFELDTLAALNHVQGPITILWHDGDPVIRPGARLHERWHTASVFELQTLCDNPHAYSWVHDSAAPNIRAALTPKAGS